MSAPQRYRPKGPLPAFAWAGRPAPQAAAPAPDAIPARAKKSAFPPRKCRFSKRAKN